MVENTIKQKNRPFWEKSFFMIAGGVFISLIFSLYWQLGNARNFFNPSTSVPQFNDTEDILSAMQSKNSQTDPYKYFSTSDGYLSVKYPSTFTDGQNIIEQTTGTAMNSNNSLLFAYRVDLSASSMMPTSLMVARYDATSTADVINSIENAMEQQQCQCQIEKKEDNSLPYEIYESTYKCGDQGDLSLWQAKIAVLKKIDREFYTVTAATISKNWENAKLEINSILDSIKIVAPPATNENGEGEATEENNNNNQENETVK